MVTRARPTTRESESTQAASKVKVNILVVDDDATKRFARRQDSWFRRDPRVHWLSGAADRRAELPRLALALLERPVTA